MIPYAIEAVGIGLALSLVGNVVTTVDNMSKDVDIANMKVEATKMDTKLDTCSRNTTSLRTNIAIQNEAISTLEVDLEEALDRWDNRESSTVYVDRWRTKYVDKNVTIEGDCNEILDAIHTYGF